MILHTPESSDETFKRKISLMASWAKYNPVQYLKIFRTQDKFVYLQHFIGFILRCGSHRLSSLSQSLLACIVLFQNRLLLHSVYSISYKLYPIYGLIFYILFYIQLNYRNGRSVRKDTAFYEKRCSY